MSTHSSGLDETQWATDDEGIMGGYRPDEWRALIRERTDSIDYNLPQIPFAALCDGAFTVSIQSPVDPEKKTEKYLTILQNNYIAKMALSRMDRLLAGKYKEVLVEDILTEVEDSKRGRKVWGEWRISAEIGTAMAGIIKKMKGQLSMDSAEATYLFFYYIYTTAVHQIVLLDQKLGRGFSPDARPEQKEAIIAAQSKARGSRGRILGYTHALKEAMAEYGKQHPQLQNLEYRQILQGLFSMIPATADGHKATILLNSGNNGRDRIIDLLCKGDLSGARRAFGQVKLWHRWARKYINAALDWELPLQTPDQSQ